MNLKKLLPCHQSILTTISRQKPSRYQSTSKLTRLLVLKQSNSKLALKFSQNRFILTVLEFKTAF